MADFLIAISCLALISRYRVGSVYSLKQVHYCFDVVFKYRCVNDIHKNEAKRFQEKIFLTLLHVRVYFVNLCKLEKNYLQQQSPYSEVELIAALKSHKNDAYRQLYLNYRGTLYNNILQVIKDTETANDVLQEVFITIWQNIDKYDAEKGRLFTWLLKLTRNAAINKTRSKVYKSQQKNDDISNYVSFIENKTSVHTPINQIGLRTQVHRLREDYKNVLELSYFEGFTQEEISKALNVPLGTVKTRLRNAIIDLRKQFV